MLVFTRRNIHHLDISILVDSSTLSFLHRAGSTMQSSLRLLLLLLLTNTSERLMGVAILPLLEGSSKTEDSGAVNGRVGSRFGLSLGERGLAEARGGGGEEGIV